jgi:hypothetical protein
MSLWLRAQRSPNPHFLRSLRHRIGNHAVNADQRQQQRHRRKRSQQDHQQTLLAHLGFHQIIHRLHVGDGLIRIERLHLPANGSGELKRIAGSAYSQHAERLGILCEGDVNAVGPARVLKVLTHMRDDSDDFRRLRVHAPNQQPLADRVETLRIRRPKMASQFFINDGHPLCVFRVMFGKVAAARQRNLQSVKVPWRDRQDFYNRPFI